MSTLASVAIAVSGDEPGVLGCIRDPGCALAVWRRSPDGQLSLLDRLDAGTIDDVAAVIAVDDLEVHVPLLIGAAGYEAPLGVVLSRDVVHLARLYAATGRWRTLRLRLDWIETDACRRFHADAVETRLLTTYVGRGTQWKRAGDDAIEELSPGDVAILKGQLLAPEPPVLHRSPPIAADGGRRLLLAIDGAGRA